MVDHLDFEAAKAVLQRVDDKGGSVYSHLTSMVQHILTSEKDTPLSIDLEEDKENHEGGEKKNGNNSLKNFEQLSYFIKNQINASFQPVPPPTSPFASVEVKAKQVGKRDVRESQDSKEEVDESLAVELRKLYVGSNAGSEEPKAVVKSVEDIVRKRDMLESIGITFSQDDWMQMYFSILSHLSMQRKPMQEEETSEPKSYEQESLKFWGIINGSSGDYFVFECEEASGDTDDTEAENSEEAEEAQDSSIASQDRSNKYILSSDRASYYVGSSMSGPWSKLPTCSAEQFRAALQINSSKILNGDLSSKQVSNFPFFKGSESHFLFAKIALVNYYCKICPSEYLTEIESQNEEADDAEDAKETEDKQRFVPLIQNPEFNAGNLELSDISSFVHYYQIPECEFGTKGKEEEEQVLRPAKKDDWTVKRRYSIPLLASHFAENNWHIYSHKLFRGFHGFVHPRAPSKVDTFYVGFGTVCNAAYQKSDMSFPGDGVFLPRYLPMPPAVLSEQAVDVRDQADLFEAPEPEKPESLKQDSEADQDDAGEQED